MKISELITLSEIAKQKFGDLDVFLHDNTEIHCENCKEFLRIPDPLVCWIIDNDANRVLPYWEHASAEVEKLKKKCEVVTAFML